MGVKQAGGEWRAWWDLSQGTTYAKVRSEERASHLVLSRSCITYWVLNTSACATQPDIRWDWMWSPACTLLEIHLTNSHVKKTTDSALLPGDVQLWLPEGEWCCPRVYRTQYFQYFHDVSGKTVNRLFFTLGPGFLWPESTTQSSFKQKLWKNVPEHVPIKTPGWSSFCFIDKKGMICQPWSTLSLSQG